MSQVDVHQKSAIATLETGVTFTAAGTTTVLGVAQDTTIWHKFLLFLDIQFAGENTSTVVDGREIQIKAQYSDDEGTTYFDYQNGFWGDLRFNDSQGNVSMKKAYQGECPGKLTRFLAIATNGAYGTTSAFTVVKAKVEFLY